MVRGLAGSENSQRISLNIPACLDRYFCFGSEHAGGLLVAGDSNE
jgi:hypothetical protein